MSQQDRDRYMRAAHAMQSGVAVLMGREVEPKHLRVGVNSAMVEHAALVKLLLDKHVITPNEYDKALADAMEREVRQYEEEIYRRDGRKVTLA